MNEQQRINKEVTEKIRRLRRKVGENIHAARRQRRMPLEKLARLSYLNADTIDRLEIGKGEIDLVQVVRLSLALNVEIGQLLDLQMAERKYNKKQ